MNTRTDKSKVHDFSLLENARDSLHHAVEHIAHDGIDDVGNIKRAIIDVFHATELLLKERLYRINPALVCRDIDSPTLRYSKTVNVYVALNRLRNLDNRPLLRRMSPTIMRCKEIRNDIVHYKFTVKVFEAKAILGKMLSLIFLFSKKVLNVDMETELRSNEKWLTLVDMADFWKAHKDAVEKDLIKKKAKVKKCPYCEANTFDLGSGSCALCGHDDTLINCYYCEKVIWRGKAEYMDELDEKGGSDYFGMPNLKQVPTCEKCWSEAMSEAYVEQQLDLARGK